MVRRRRARRQPGFRGSDSQYMMRRMMDMNTMAVGGMIGIGTLGMVGSILKPGP